MKNKRSQLEIIKNSVINHKNDIIVPDKFDMSIVENNSCFIISTNNDLNGSEFKHDFNESLFADNIKPDITSLHVNFSLNNEISKIILHKWFNASCLMINLAHKYISDLFNPLKQLYLNINQLNTQIIRMKNDAFKLVTLIENNKIQNKNNNLNINNNEFINKNKYLNEKIKLYESKKYNLYNSKKFVIKRIKIISLYNEILFDLNDIIITHEFNFSEKNILNQMINITNENKNKYLKNYDFKTHHVSSPLKSFEYYFEPNHKFIKLLEFVYHNIYLIDFIKDSNYFDNDECQTDNLSEWNKLKTIINFELTNEKKNI